jgi:hypothetical protein
MGNRLMPLMAPRTCYPDRERTASAAETTTLTIQALASHSHLSIGLASFDLQTSVSHARTCRPAHTTTTHTGKTLALHTLEDDLL